MTQPGSPFSPEAESRFTEWISRRAAGDPVDVHQLCAGKPELERELRAMVELHELAENASRATSPDEPAPQAASPAASPAAPPPAALERLRAVATRGHRYRAVGEIARGGMGSIVEAWDLELRRRIAMKVVG